MSKSFQRSIFGVSVILLLPCGAGCKPDIEEVIAGR
jgi:hypothetical protein